MKPEMEDGQVVNLASRSRGVFEEALRECKKDLLVSAVTGTVLSIVGYVVLGLLVYVFVLYLLSRAVYRRGGSAELSFPIFFALYTLIVAVLMVVGIYYRPKERYDFGYVGRGFVADRPFTMSDDLDRAHASLGFLLVIPNFIRLNLVTLKDVFTSGGAVVDPVLAGGIIILAQEGALPGRILRVYARHGEEGVSKAIDTLKTLRWVKVDGHLISLTRKGLEVLRRAGLE